MAAMRAPGPNDLINRKAISIMVLDPSLALPDLKKRSCLLEELHIRVLSTFARAFWINFEILLFNNVAVAGSATIKRLIRMKVTSEITFKIFVSHAESDNLRLPSTESIDDLIAVI
jgi:hypothetical protein